jgi:hypothetical protein
MWALHHTHSDHWLSKFQLIVCHLRWVPPLAGGVQREKWQTWVPHPLAFGLSKIAGFDFSCARTAHHLA